MKDFIKRHYESAWIRLAAWILIGRNVKRCKVVSRRDNNDMWYMAEKLQSISKRISTKYKMADNQKNPPDPKNRNREPIDGGLYLKYGPK